MEDKNIRNIEDNKNINGEQGKPKKNSNKVAGENARKVLKIAKEYKKSNVKNKREREDIGER